MHLIGINGFKRSGKGTVADIIAGIYNDGEANVLGVGFADKMKILAAKSLGLTHVSDAECIALMDEAKETWTIHVAPSGLSFVKNVPDSKTEAYGITGRQYLQNLGNEARGVFGDTFWIDMVLPDPKQTSGWENAAAAALAFRYPDVDCLCITDLRYPNEAQRVKALGGVVWEVVRPGLSSDGHVSEQPLPRELVDYVIDNSGDLRNLEREVERAMDTLA